jgi:hypothetical protein
MVAMVGVGQGGVGGGDGGVGGGGGLNKNWHIIAPPAVWDRRVAQVPGEGITTTESGCPRCLAFGHLGEHRDYFPEFPR